MSRASVRQHLVSNCAAASVRLPLDFISCVHPCTSSCISSGATWVRDQDSSQRGFGGAAGSSLLPALEPERGVSLDLKTFLKKGMMNWGGEGPHEEPSCGGGSRQWQWQRQMEGMGRVSR